MIQDKNGIPLTLQEEQEWVGDIFKLMETQNDPLRHYHQSLLFFHRWKDKFDLKEPLFGTKNE